MAKNTPVQSSHGSHPIPSHPIPKNIPKNIPSRHVTNEQTSPYALSLRRKSVNTVLGWARIQRPQHSNSTAQHSTTHSRSRSQSARQAKSKHTPRKKRRRNWGTGTLGRARASNPPRKQPHGRRTWGAAARKKKGGGGWSLDRFSFSEPDDLSYYAAPWRFITATGYQVLNLLDCLLSLSPFTGTWTSS